MENFNVADFTDDAIASRGVRYERRINALKAQVPPMETKCIEQTVNEALTNIRDHSARSFVVYGEPQSGKTEMMIALTAKLLDEGHKIIIILLNDSVQLLEQNHERFMRSGIDPAAKIYSDIIDKSVEIGESEWIVFCKKNHGDLQKLIDKVGTKSGKVIIDDEADYASPNSKINKDEKTRIFQLVEKLIGTDGVYIGVTATPARLDLNNTFQNDNAKWVDFPAHPDYTGHDVFFPTNINGLEHLKFSLRRLPDEGDDPKHLREAVFGFLVNVAHINMEINSVEKNYCMLIHTSGIKADHEKDYDQVVKIINALKNEHDKNFEPYLKRIFEIAAERYQSGRDITSFIRRHINRNDIVVMNSNRDKHTVDYKRGTDPSAMFTFAIGGNIVSRGVTFKNLLCMFFTRDVKHRLQQDTYIQRARMFGTRGSYLKYFELHIPEKLYYDWQKCFVFHSLSLSLIREDKGSPVWLEDSRISAVASNSIDKANVTLDSGEMSWSLFEYSPQISAIESSTSKTQLEKVQAIATLVGDQSLPNYLIDFLKNLSPEGDKSIAVHATFPLKETYTTADRENISRKGGFIGTTQLEKAQFPLALHHIMVIKNDAGQARVFYKYTPEKGTLKFLRNELRSSVV